MKNESDLFNETPLMADYGVLLNDIELQQESGSKWHPLSFAFDFGDRNGVKTAAISSKTEEVKKHKTLREESVEVGLLFASKPIVQVIVNAFIGPLTNRIGYSVPMFAGFIIMFISTLGTFPFMFAVGDSYLLLFFARAFQGAGSACTSTSGMGMLADRYCDDRERGNAMAIALSGLALGVMIGPPFGGIMYQFLGKSAPFLILAAITLFDGLFQLVVLKPRIKPEKIESAPFKHLLADPYIILAAGSITFANMSIAALEASLPLWFMDTMQAPEWQQGMVFLPASVSYLIGTNVFGFLGHLLGRWLSSMLGFFIIGSSLIVIAVATNLHQLILPNAGIGFAIGMVDSTMMPMLGHLVDIRHTSTYGNVYAIGDAAFCVGFILGPLVSSAIMKTLGFRSLMRVLAAVAFMYAPLHVLLQKPPHKKSYSMIKSNRRKSNTQC